MKEDEKQTLQLSSKKILKILTNNDNAKKILKILKNTMKSREFELVKQRSVVTDGAKAQIAIWRAL